MSADAWAPAIERVLGRIEATAAQVKDGFTVSDRTGRKVVRRIRAGVDLGDYPARLLHSDAGRLSSRVPTPATTAWKVTPLP